MGITKSGDTTEQLVLELCPSAKANPDRSGKGKAKGDVIFSTPQGEEFYVEVKKTTWNQTRPSKYIPIVGLCDGQWYVVPPHEIVKKCLGRKGQHTPNPLVCIGLGKPKMSGWWYNFAVKTSDLEKEIIKAHRKGQKHTKFKKFAQESMAQVLKLIERQQKTLERLV